MFWRGTAGEVTQIKYGQKYLKTYKLRMKKTAARCFRASPPKSKLEMLKLAQTDSSSALFSKRPSCRWPIQINDSWGGLGWEKPVKHKLFLGVVHLWIRSMHHECCNSTLQLVLQQLHRCLLSFKGIFRVRYKFSTICSVHLFKLSTIQKNYIGSYLEKENQGYNEVFIMEVNGDIYWRI